MVSGNVSLSVSEPRFRENFQGFVGLMIIGWYSGDGGFVSGHKKAPNLIQKVVLENLVTQTKQET